MLEFILKYWVEFVFGIIAAWLVAKIKYFQKLEQEKTEQEQAMLEKKITDTLEAKIKESEAISFAQDTQLKADIANMNQTVMDLNQKIATLIQDVATKQEVTTIKDGVLSIQKEHFLRQCNRLLDPSHAITFDEYKQCIADHNAYNALGGNSTGDHLFASIEAKYNQKTISS